MLATVLLITHVKNKEIESAKNEINAFKSQQVQFQTSQKLLTFHRTDFGSSDISIAIHSNSIAGSVITYTAIEFEWIAIEMSEVCAVESEQFLWFLKLDLLWFEGIYLILGTFDFLVFLTWVMRRTVAKINPKIIHFDAVDFSGHHSKKL